MFVCNIGFIHDLVVNFFFKRETAYDLRISDWSSDVCSSDLGVSVVGQINGISSVAADDDVVTGKVFNLLCGTITNNGIVTGRSSQDIGAAVNGDADHTGSRIAVILGGIDIELEIQRSRIGDDLDIDQLKLAAAAAYIDRLKLDVGKIGRTSWRERVFQ